MSPGPPTVLHPMTLLNLLEKLVTTRPFTQHHRINLVVCSSREEFIRSLLSALQKRTNRRKREAQSHIQNDDPVGDDLPGFLNPILHNLLSTRQVGITYCASVHALLAYLAGETACSGGVSAGSTKSHITAKRADIGAEQQTTETMILLDPLRLHRSTSFFSAQGLSRTFAAAVECAERTGRALVVVECVDEPCPSLGVEPGEKTEDAGQEQEMHDDKEAEMMTVDDDQEHEGTGAEDDVEDPWEQGIGILNLTGKKFGSGMGERAWVGRTVKVRRVAERWMRFCSVEDDHSRKMIL